ncbi:sulfoxide reductase heme-binding subunit YedZ [Sulfuritortus calidifontis]|uniref:Protein-methionine-sulfoxide reductase heme-binding subunit MsrQ n=1 Tax=Sulfuritortus calidifontis TaxID=1914471 RepID=A0A4V2UQY7_9PROT|nr:protein-methionine-sulfoxide reductase heme-binding subunit MsrQ [Sulfuritortus calidifontis]TCS73356.1 sulfoxide reductase heme-binding subunit YedZ [Sulfuritortus calidifontis]
MAFLRDPKPWLFLICLYPLARLGYLGYTDGLGVNPIEFITRSLGTWTLTGLLLTLAVTPARRLTGRASLVRHRRMLGLFAFFYGVLHLLSYLWLDQFFDWAAMVKDVLKRPFITFGMVAFLLLLPLALTSTQAAMRRLGRNWQRVHWLIYPAAIAGVLHYGWLVKKDLTQPLIYGGILALFLGLRVFWRYKKTKAG